MKNNSVGYTSARKSFGRIVVQSNYSADKMDRFQMNILDFHQFLFLCFYYLFMSSKTRCMDFSLRHSEFVYSFSTPYINCCLKTKQFDFHVRYYNSSVSNFCTKLSRCIQIFFRIILSYFVNDIIYIFILNKVW